MARFIYKGGIPPEPPVPSSYSIAIQYSEVPGSSACRAPMLTLARYDDRSLRRRCLLKAEAQVRKPQPARLVLATARAGGGGNTVGATQRRAAEELLHKNPLTKTHT